MPATGATVTVTEVKMKIVWRILGSRSAAIPLVKRAQIVLLVFAKPNTEEISESVAFKPV